MGLARLFPNLGRQRMERLALGPGGTLDWIARDDQQRLNAFFGSRELWEAQPRNWDEFNLREPSRTVTLLDHGYDTSQPIEHCSTAELKTAAAFRGGHFLGDTFDPDKDALFRCALGHDFNLTPRLYLKGGHWCPACMFDQNSYQANAETNPFFAQVWPDQD